jgi:hypothetical protein
MDQWKKMFYFSSEKYLKQDWLFFEQHKPLDTVANSVGSF